MNKVTLLVLSLFLSSSVVFAAQQVDIATYDVLPPFAYKDDQGKLTGVYIEIVKKAVSRMPHYTVAFVVLPWARAKQRVEKGLVFAILPPYFHAHDWLTKTEPQRPYIWPYSLALFTQRDVVVCNNRVLSVPRDNYPQDYKGLNFVMWRSDGRAGEEFTNMVKEKKIKLQLLNDVKSTVPMLRSGRADCTVTSRIPFAWYVKQLKDSGDWDKFSERDITLKEAAVISSNQGYLGYTDINTEKRYPYKKDFTIKFDIEIFKMKRSGEIQQIVDRFVK